MNAQNRRIWLFLLLLWGTHLAGPAPALGDAAPSLSTIAGSYFEGDGMIIARSLVIRPDGTFEYEMEGGVRLLQAEARGTASVADGTLVLAPKTEKGKGEPVPRRLAIVRWGPRLYLVPEPGMLEFANLVNEGFEPRPRRPRLLGVPARRRLGEAGDRVAGRSGGAQAVALHEADRREGAPQAGQAA
jgi:hypothetical protein